MPSQIAALACIFGRPKTGKTADCLMSFWGCEVLPGDPGAVKMAERLAGRVLGRDFTVTPCASLVNVTARVKAIRAGKKRPTALIIDDFSRQVSARFDELQKKLTGYKLFGALREEVIDLRDDLRELGITTVLNTWETPPKQKGAALIKGGPMLQGDLPEHFPGICDLVMRAVPNPDAVGKFKSGYQCEPSHPSYIMGDRDHISMPLGPINIGEILRAGGYAVPRMPRIAQVQEEYAELLAEALLETDADDTEQKHNLALAVVRKLQALDWEDAWIRLTVRDGRDRAIIREFHESRSTPEGMIDDLFDSDGQSVGGLTVSSVD